MMIPFLRSTGAIVTSDDSEVIGRGKMANTKPNLAFQSVEESSRHIGIMLRASIVRKVEIFA
jgi:hypothetical protein